MSYVTNVALFVHEDDDNAEQIAKVNEYFTPACGEPGCKGFHVIDPHAVGGTKALEADIYVGAFNYLNEAQLVRFMQEIEWEQPQAVLLMVKDQDEEQWRIVKVNP